jgi:hypothetical protein
MRKINVTISAIVMSILFLSPYAQEEADDSGSPSGEKAAPARINAIQTNPLSLYAGSLGFNYEHLFLPNSGLLIEADVGSSSAYKGFGLGIHYRRHYKSRDNQKGLDSPFWGPFINFASYTSKAEITTSTSTNYGPAVSSTSTVPFSVTYAVIGANWGRRWIWDSGINLVFRIGYGFPIAKINFKDSQNVMNSDSERTFASVMKLIYGIDGELSIGYAF